MQQGTILYSAACVHRFGVGRERREREKLFHMVATCRQGILVYGSKATRSSITHVVLGKGGHGVQYNTAAADPLQGLDAQNSSFGFGRPRPRALKGALS
jgi:hypothetical protein